GHFAAGYEDLQINSGAKIEGTAHHHIAFSKNNGLLELFVDGVSVGQTTAAMTPYIQNSSPLYIGALNSSTLHFVGSIDAVRVYRRALTSSEIKDLATH
ncbi:MAG: LamG domain-containing protein, partial [Deltaproteobacteria bacterium]